MTNKFKGTPGPWKVVCTEIHPSHTNEQIAIIQTSEQPAFDLSAIESKRMSREQFIANANVMAASPELLEALKGLVGWSAHLPKAADAELEFARLTINKALNITQE